MARVEARLEGMGLVLPQPMQPPPGVEFPFAWVRVRGNRAYVSGHGPLNPDGSLCGPFGKVGAAVSPEEGYEAARRCALSVLASLKRELGDIDRVSAWLVVHGGVDGSSDLVLELYGLQAGTQARTVPGAATLTLNHTVFVAAEVETSTRG